MESIIKPHFRSELRKIDWDFRTVHGEGLHTAHWYPARFIPEIPLTLIGYFSSPRDVVLDPFCGSGTTLVEANRYCRKSIGIDSNPIAILMSQAKLMHIEEKVLKKNTNYLIDRLHEMLSNISFNDLSSCVSENLINGIPNPKANKEWYHRKTLLELSIIFNEIKRLEKDLHIVAKTVFSGMLRALSSQDKHWGYICDNVKPKTKIYKKAVELFIQRLNEFINTKINYEKNRISIRKALVGMLVDQETEPNYRLIHGDALRNLQAMPKDKVDLIVTSPPYLNVTDYTKSQRLSLLWYPEYELTELMKEEIGARYKRFRSNSLKEYISYLSFVAAELRRVLKNQKYACMIIGESTKHNPYKKEFEAIMDKYKFRLKEKYERSIAQKRSLSPRLHTEVVYVYRLERD